MKVINSKIVILSILSIGLGLVTGIILGPIMMLLIIGASIGGFGNLSFLFLGLYFIGVPVIGPISSIIVFVIRRKYGITPKVTIWSYILLIFSLLYSTPPLLIYVLGYFGLIDL